MRKPYQKNDITVTQIDQKRLGVVYVLTLGLSSFIGVTTSFSSALWFGLLAFIIMLLSSLVLALIKPLTPSSARIPVHIIIVSAIVLMAQLMTRAFAPALEASWGLYLPLFGISYLFLMKADFFESHSVLKGALISTFYIGVGLIISLLLVGLVRELFGTGAIAFFNPLTEEVIFTLELLRPARVMGFFIQPMGGFLGLGLLLALINRLLKRKEA